MFISQLKEYFRPDFASLMGEFVSGLQGILEQYDTVVFVARRAMSLYEALAFHGLVVRGERSDQVVSSRALSFASCDLSGRSVAIVDDVMVEGEAMRRASRYACADASVCTGLVAAGCADRTESILGDLSSRVSVLRTLDECDVYELTREINDFIHSAGLSNNIDQPEFNVALPNACDLRDVLRGHEWCDCTTNLQRALGILSASITYDPDKLLMEPMRDVLSLDNYEDALVKVRIHEITGTGKAKLLPFVVLPTLDASQIDCLYAYFVSCGLAPDAATVSARASDTMEETKNKLRIVQYLLSWRLGNSVVESLRVASYSVATSREFALFGGGISNQRLVSALSAMPCLDAELPVGRDQGRGYRSVAQAARVLFLRDDLLQSKSDRDGLLVTVRDLRRADLLDMVARTDAKMDNSVFPSVCLDYLIDCGILVPKLQMDKSGTMVRAYRSGEIERLSRHEMTLFSKVLYDYLAAVPDKRISCSTVNRLGVLFSREAQRGRGAGNRDETNVFDFAYTKGAELRRLDDYSPYSGCLLPDILVAKGYFLWSDEGHQTIRLNPNLVSRLGQMDHGQKSLAKAITRRFKNYRSVATDEQSLDKLLDTLIMHGSKRYVLGDVGRASADVREALEDARDRLRSGEDVDYTDVASTADSLRRVCHWAIDDTPDSDGDKPLSVCFQEVAELLDDYYAEHDLRLFTDDQYSSNGDVQRFKQLIVEIRQYSIDVCGVARAGDANALPVIRRLIARGQVLNQKTRVLLGLDAITNKQFSIADNEIGIISCTKAASTPGGIDKSYGFHPRTDAGTKGFSLRQLASLCKTQNAGIMAVAFRLGSSNPHEILWAGEEQPWRPMGIEERFCKLFPNQLSEAVKALCNEYVGSQTQRLAVCYPAEDRYDKTEVTNPFLDEVGYRVTTTQFLDLKEDLVKLFEQCGVGVILCGFEEQ